MASVSKNPVVRDLRDIIYSSAKRNLRRNPTVYNNKYVKARTLKTYLSDVNVKKLTDGITQYCEDNNIPFNSEGILIKINDRGENRWYNESSVIIRISLPVLNEG